MRILALDVGQRTGFAERNSESPSPVWAASGAVDFKWENYGYGRRLWQFSQWLMDGFRWESLDAVVYEIPNQRGGPATRMLIGLTSVIELKCAAMNVDCLGVALTTLKKYATGKGNTKGKAAMMARASEIMGQPIDSDDEADAICLLSYAFSLDAIPRTA